MTETAHLHHTSHWIYMFSQKKWCNITIKKKPNKVTHTLLQNCTATDDLDFQMNHIFLSVPAREEGAGRMETLQLFIYLPVSSFEHHSKGSMSNQVFSAVLKVSHSLHPDVADGPADAGH